MTPPAVDLADLDVLVDGLANRVAGSGARHLLGICGPPGAGKSTIAQRVVAGVADRVPAAVAPMDGFHRSNEDLAAAGLLALKGIPDSFDAAGFVAHLRALRAGGDVAWPTYDRGRQEVVPGGRTITAATCLIVVEGNYLLLGEPPWDEVRPLLDAVWYLDVAEEVIVSRLQRRHERDRTPEEAAAKVVSTDLPNAALVAATRHRADLVLR